MKNVHIKKILTLFIKTILVFSIILELPCSINASKNENVNIFYNNKRSNINRAFKLPSVKDQVDKVVIIDSQITDINTLLNCIKINAEIWLLNKNDSAIDQITNLLGQYHNLSAIYLLSHGSPGILHLGSEEISAHHLKMHAQKLNAWGKSLTESGDFFLYGCRVAETETGKTFVKQFARIVEADVAASIGITGSQLLGGNWNLEFITGNISKKSDLIKNDDAYNAILALTEVSSETGVNISSGSVYFTNVPKVIGTYYITFSATVEVIFQLRDGRENRVLYTNYSTTYSYGFDLNTIYTTYTLMWFNNNGDTTLSYTLYEGAPDPGAEINIKGNNNDISDGDTTPSLTDDTDFGLVDISSGTTDHTFIIENSGGAALTLTDDPKVKIEGTHSADFSVTSQPSSPIAENVTSTFTVRFDPSDIGVRTATISIANADDDENPYNFSIQGTGVTPELNVVGNSLTINHADTTPSDSDHTLFDPTKVDNDTSTRTYTIENQGLVQLDVTHITIAGTHQSDFTLYSQSVGLAIASESAASISVTFNPSSKGVRTAEVQIISADTDESPYTFTIQGIAYPVPQIDHINDLSVSKNSTANTHSFGSSHVDGSALTLTIASSEPGLISTVSGYLALSCTSDIQYIKSTAPGVSVYTFTGGFSAETISLSITPIANTTGTSSLTITISDSLGQSISDSFTISVGGLEIYGNNHLISNGDVSPSVPDNTDYGSVLIDHSASTTMSYSLSNSFVGSHLTLTGTPDLIEILGDHASDFTILAQPDSTILTANTSIKIDIKFDPSATGTRTAIVTIEYSDPNAKTYTFNIQGTGVTPELNVVGNSLTINHADSTPTDSDFTQFDPTKVDNDTSTQNYTLENQGSGILAVNNISVSGTDPNDFTVNSQSVGATIAAGGSAPFSVTFNPLSKGVKTAVIEISSTDADENPYTFTIKGTAFPVPEISSMDDTIIRENSKNNPIDFTCNHVDGSALTLSVASSEPDLLSTVVSYMNISGDGKTFYMGQSAPGVAVYTMTGALSALNYALSLTPLTDASGTLYLTITITDALLQTASQSLMITIALEPDLGLMGNHTSIHHGDRSPSVSDDTDFGKVLIDSGSTSRSYSLVNSGYYPLTLTNKPNYIQVTGDHGSDFSVDAQPSSNTIAGNESVLFTVTFDPSDLGMRTAEIQIDSSDPDTATYTFVIQGTGVTPELSIQGNGLTIVNTDNTPSFADHTIFSSTKVDSDTASRSYVVENLGTGQLSISNISVSGTNSSDFTVASQAVGSTLAAGESAYLTVTFDPSAKGIRNAQISITSTDADENPYTFSIKGTGYPVPEISSIDDTIVKKNSTNNPIDFTCNHVNGSELTLSVATSEPAVISSVLGYMGIEGDGNSVYSGQSAPGVAVYTLTGALGAENFTLSLTPLTDASGTIYLTLTITDSLLQTASQSFMITIPNIYTVCPEGCDYTSIAWACNNAIDNMQIKITSGGTYFVGSLNIAKAITLSTVEASEPVTIVTDDLIVSDQTGLLLNDQTILSIAGNLTNNGIIRYDSCSPQSLIVFNQTGDKTLKNNGMTVCHMIIDKHNGITTVDALSLAGSLTVLSGEFTNSSEMTVSHLIINDTVYLNGQTTITSDLLITENGKLDAQDATIRIAGDWRNNGTFIPQESQAEFIGQAQQVVSCSEFSNQLNFYNFTLNGSSIKMDNDLVILNNLSVITGIMDTNSHDIFTGGNWSNDGNFVHSERTVYLNATSGDKTLAQTDYFYNMTIGVSGGQASIHLLSSITIENNLHILSGSTMDLNANNLTIAHQFTNQGYLTANGGTTAFSRLNRANSPAHIYASGSHSSFNDVVLVCEPGAKFVAVNEFTVDGNLTIDGCVFHANYLDYSGELTTINGGSIIKFTSVPSLNEWGIMLFIGLLGLLGVMRLRKNRTTRTIV